MKEDRIAREEREMHSQPNEGNERIKSLEDEVAQLRAVNAHPKTLNQDLMARLDEVDRIARDSFPGDFRGFAPR